MARGAINNEKERRAALFLVADCKLIQLQLARAA